MKKEIKTEIRIQAPAEKVWNILTAFGDYPQWNPFIKSIEGTARVGSKITARIEAPGSKGMTFKPTVLVFDPNKEFRWIGHLLFPGLFDGEHRFELIDNGDHTTTFIQAEKFNGILVPLLRKMLDGGTIEGFRAMNNKLKELCEK
ncbi:SRPBCC domain-containing protein [Fluviicola sp.]|uniref:SRPBCC domain-containing protein n=1 Tax=Fluviicola sp. TaxID=1917219 RepID=UPI0031CF2CC0